MNDPLHAHSPEALREELTGFPESTIQAMVELKSNPSPGAIEESVLRILEFYLPSGSETQIVGTAAETRLREDLGIDSLTFAEAAFKLEELFAIRIEHSELVDLETVGSLRQFIESRIAS